MEEWERKQCGVGKRELERWAVEETMEMHNKHVNHTAKDQWHQLHQKATYNDTYTNNSTFNEIINLF